MTYIVTHPLKPSLDEFLACAVLLAHDISTCRIIRREPEEGELDDQNIVVVGAGMRLQPHLRNYDPQNLYGCQPYRTLSTVVEYELSASALEALTSQPWFRPLPMSLIDAALLGMFENERFIDGGMLYNMMLEIGRTLIGSLQ